MKQNEFPCWLSDTPNLALLPAIASILQISIDQLMGYSHSLALETDYEKRYQTEEYYWGLKPSQMCLKIVELMPPEKENSYPWKSDELFQCIMIDCLRSAQK